jgi:hypothetical protein
MEYLLLKIREWRGVNWATAIVMQLFSSLEHLNKWHLEKLPTYK